MKSPVAFSIVALAIGINSDAFAQGAPVSGPSPGGIAQPGAYSGATGSPGARPTAAPSENNTYEGDDTLYRGKTTETENPMLRDEGPLHFKTRPKEKIQEVDSLKNLQSSGSDPKFQGSLLNSAVTEIQKVNEKANEARDAADEGDPRFKTTRLTFTPDKTDKPKKAQSDSSPSPTPSPTASPTGKNSSGLKQ
jgi:hypothetical protein